MIWVLLQSELPWQCNDAIMFFIYLCVFWWNRLREYVPAIIAIIMAKFEQILWERYGNILKQSFKNHIHWHCFQVSYARAQLAKK